MAVIKRSQIILIAVVLCLILVCNVSARIDSQTSLYLPLNGTTGTTVFTDFSPVTKTISTVGAGVVVDINTTQVKFGSASGYFGGKALESSNQSAGFEFGSGDWTISFWENSPKTATYTGGMFFQKGADNYTAAIIIYMTHATGVPKIYGDYGTAVGTTPLSINEWNYHAITKNASTLAWYVNGTLIMSTAAATSTAPVNFIWVGVNDDANNFFTGYMDDVVIIKGRAVDGAIVPTREFLTNPTNTLAANATIGETPFTFQFNASWLGNTPTTNQWNATNVTGNNVPFTMGTNLNQSYTFTVAGNYSIQHTATNTFGSDTNSANTYWINVSAPYVPQRSTIQTITHDFGTDITYALVTLTKPGEVFSVSNLTSTTFDLTITNAVSGLAGTNQTVYWCVG